MELHRKKKPVLSREQNHREKFPTSVILLNNLKQEVKKVK